MKINLLRIVKPAMCCLLATVAGGVVQAQAFVTPVDQVAMSRDSYLILNDGTRFDGKIEWVMGAIDGGLKSVTFRPDSGKKIKYTAADVKRLGVKVIDRLRLEMVSKDIAGQEEHEGLPGVPRGSHPARAFAAYKAFSSVDWESILEREFIVYDQALLPPKKKKKERYRLLQLLNPGFDHLIKVYRDTGATVKVIGKPVNRRAYQIVTPESPHALQVGPDNYQAQFHEIFGGCQQFIEAYEERTPGFEDIAAHIFAYDRICREEQSE